MKKVAVLFVVLCLLFVCPVDAERDMVKPGKGISAVSIGDKQEDVKKKLGDYEKDSKPNWWIYRKKLGIDVLFGGRHADEVIEVRFNEKYRNKLDTGIGIGSKMKDVFKKYGDPLLKVRYTEQGAMVNDRHLYHVVKEKADTWKICYNKKGVLFWFDKRQRVKQFVVYKTAVREPAFETMKCPCCGKQIVILFGKPRGYVEE